MVNPSTGKGRVSLITGSTSPVGIGFAMARVFAKEGAKVVVSDLSSRKSHGEAAAKQLNDAHGPGTAIFVPLDVTKESEWDSAVSQIEEKLGPLDVSCLNAGIPGAMHAPGETLDQLDLAEYRKIMEINEMGVVIGLKYSAKSMAKNKVEEWKVCACRISIVITSSVAGMFADGSGPNMGYFGSKWAVRGVAKVAAGLGSALKIRANSIHPGLIATELTQSVGWVADAAKGSHIPQLEPMVQSLNVKRFAMPEEVANVALLLAGIEGSYVSGQSYVIDTGFFKG
ncbi:hypothetical protein DFJ74DRAFT_613403 [Hyaloraphidium curvatum]|nr:hypothetical protein DFJ74DRAFT_613403 [Hyaloraphidium curvatum]